MNMSCTSPAVCIGVYTPPVHECLLDRPRRCGRRGPMQQYQIATANQLYLGIIRKLCISCVLTFLLVNSFQLIRKSGI